MTSTKQEMTVHNDSISDTTDEDRMAATAWDHHLKSQRQKGSLEIVVTELRIEHLFRDVSGDVEVDNARSTIAVREPLTAIEKSLLDTNDERLVRLAFPVLASLIEREINIRHGYGPDDSAEMNDPTRGSQDSNVTYH
jgi:hypothetical protein